MSKSVLVIDTPENCGKCKFISGFWCRAMNGRRVPNNDVIPNWCPLKPLPDKMKLTGVYGREYFQSNGKMPSYKIGWNQCIDEITGGE
jgi:hypothetical protein|nr:MAG TPA: hypothetical protein [Caudoviricetes sp.]